MITRAHRISSIHQNQNRAFSCSMNSGTTKIVCTSTYNYVNLYIYLYFTPSRCSCNVSILIIDCSSIKRNLVTKKVNPRAMVRTFWSWRYTKSPRQWHSFSFEAREGLFNKPTRVEVNLYRLERTCKHTKMARSRDDGSLRLSRLPLLEQV